MRHVIHTQLLTINLNYSYIRIITFITLISFLLYYFSIAVTLFWCLSFCSGNTVFVELHIRLGGKDDAQVKFIFTPGHAHVNFKLSKNFF